MSKWCTCEVSDNHCHVHGKAPIGRLIPWTSEGFVLCCEDCYLHGRADHVSIVTSHPGASKVCRINVFPYKGTCRFCSRVLVEPATDRWPELFDGRNNNHYPEPESKVVDLNAEQVNLVKHWVGGRPIGKPRKVRVRKSEHLLDAPCMACGSYGCEGGCVR